MEQEDFYNWALNNPAASKHAETLKSIGVYRESMLSPDIVSDIVSFINPATKLPYINIIEAKDIVSEYRKTVNYAGIGVFWDIENVPPPEGYSIAEATKVLRKTLAKKFGKVLDFKVYVDVKNNSSIDEFGHVSLNDCGVDVVHACHMRRKEVADKMIIVDSLWFALNRRVDGCSSLPTVCIISGDSDFSPLISKLTMNGFHTVSITGESSKVRSVNAMATDHFTWANFGLIPPQPAAAPNVVAPAAGGVGQPAANSTEMERTQSQPPDQGEDVHHNLLQAILAVQERGKGCMGRDGPEGSVRRSIVGIEFAKRNFLGETFSEVINRAVADQVVQAGGSGGNSWVLVVANASRYLLATSDQKLHFTDFVLDTFKVTIDGANYIRVLYGPFPSYPAGTAFAHSPGMIDAIELMWVDSPEAINAFQVNGSVYHYNEQDLTSQFFATTGLHDMFVKPGQRWCICKHKLCTRGSSCHFLHVRAY